ncbi:MAG: SH3 domain-containing protein [Xanthomarina sp.]
MKKLLFLTILSLFLKSCSTSEDSKCNSLQVKSNLKSHLLETSFIRYGGDYSTIFNVSDKDIEQVFHQVIKITHVKTLSQDANLKSCKCQASLIFEVNEDVMEEIKKITNSPFGQILSNGLTDKNGIEINYTVQETADGDMQVEAERKNDLDTNITVYSLALKGFEKVNEEHKHMIDGEGEFTEETSNSSATQNPANLKHGTITGSDIILRANPTTDSEILDVIKGSGEKVKILEILTVGNSTQAITKSEGQINIDGEFVKLPEGRAVNILARNDENKTATVSFNDANSIERTTNLDYKYLEFISDSEWYKVETQKAKIGWVYGKFINEGAAYTAKDLQLNSKKILIYSTPQVENEYAEQGGDDWGYFTDKVLTYFIEKHPGVELSEFYSNNLSSKEIEVFKKELNLEGFGYVLIDGDRSQFLVHNMYDEIIVDACAFFKFNK